MRLASVVLSMIVLVMLGGMSVYAISETAPGPEDISGTLVVMTPLDITIEHPFYAEAKAWFDDFEEAYPNVDIEFRLTGWGPDVAVQFNLAAETGDVPDLIFFSRPEIPVILLTGALANLNPYIERDMDRSDFVEWILDGCTYYGQTVAIPVGTEYRALMYRKDLLAEAGLEAPATWEELSTVTAQALTKDTDGDGQVDIWGYGIQGAAGTSYFWPQHLIQAGGALTDGDGKAIYDSPAGIKALQWWVDLMHTYKVVDPGNVEAGTDQLRDAFIAGKLAMVGIDTGGGLVARLEIEAPELLDKIDFVALPKPEGGKYASFAGGWTYIMTKQCENPEAAWAFIKFMASPEMQLRMNKHLGGVPARKSALADEYYGTGLMGRIIEVTGEYGVEFPYDTVGDFWTILDTAIQEALLQLKTPEQALQDAVTEYNTGYAGQFGQ